ncbi:MAG: hypothetical protein NWF01_09580 [Candidatus Bathyarchaeota archaeon]|nr:hypothetical protein [Candidatus Bathyarchaeota archaeon]
MSKPPENLPIVQQNGAGSSRHQSSMQASVKVQNTCLHKRNAKCGGSLYVANLGFVVSLLHQQLMINLGNSM